MKTKQEIPKTAHLVQSFIPPDLYVKLKALAEQEQRSISFMVGRCIRQYLEEQA